MGTEEKKDRGFLRIISQDSVENGDALREDKSFCGRIFLRISSEVPTLHQILADETSTRAGPRFCPFNN